MSFGHIYLVILTFSYKISEDIKHGTRIVFEGNECPLLAAHLPQDHILIKYVDIEHTGIW